MPEESEKISYFWEIYAILDIKYGQPLVRGALI